MIGHSQDTTDTHSATAGTESLLAEVLAGVLRVDRVPVEGHFFEDLGADSLLMAQFCARVRKRGDLPAVSMKDVYRHSTIRSLAAAFTDSPPPPEPTSSAPPSPEPTATLSPEHPARAVAAPPDATDSPDASAISAWKYLVCGTAQLLVFAGFSCVGALIAVHGYQWIDAGVGTADVYLRAVAFGAVVFVGLCALSIVAKWTLIGRFTAREIPLWSLAYLRFWCVKTLIRTSPARLFPGSPLYVLYLRALGARIAKGVTVLTRNIPVCTDLISIGSGTVIRKDVFMSGYRAHGGRIETGPVTLGAEVTIAEQSVIDIGTSMGDGSQLGHASSLHPGQSVPAGQSWHGTPARPTSTDFRAVESVSCGTLRRAVYGSWQFLGLVLVYFPLTLAGIGLLLALVPQLNAVVTAGGPDFTSPALVAEALVASLVGFFGVLLAALVIMTTVPKVLGRVIEPGRTYPLYGFHYGVQRLVMLMTNVRFLVLLFGDSSAIVHYLRSLGYDLCRVQQTGSNFGSLVKHETPYLSRVGSGTMVADGLSIINADFSSTSFRYARTSIGESSFLGNNIVYPSRARVGDNCLLATKVMVPIDGPVRQGVGLLGSPSFEIPRTVYRDSRFDDLATGDELRRRLAGKNRHNAQTAGLFLLMQWFHFFVLAVVATVAVDLYPDVGPLVFAAAGLLSLSFTVAFFAAVERTVTRRHPLQPLYCSIYDPSFWQHERFWKLTTHRYMQVFNGTPFKALVWRLLGVRIGRQVFDDGCSLIERSLVSIGDRCTLNAATVVQCHSQEDGAFKSDRIAIGAGVTLGVGAFVHYGTTIHDRAQLAADSFLMKGEEVPAESRWSGNPAEEVEAAVEPSPARARLH
ncbi:Pls/PosA family non-ribosomal peptide synthetase [Streptomyces cadmiisoli]|uniref:Pls/PosA family non-ribosomal peptide synthetase n=1 Tax=Streptomyces cadmiisoli TaxID=2184053 RepID=UPI003D70FAAD